MTYAARPTEFVPCVSETPTSVAVAKRRGILGRIYDAILESRRKRAELDIARFLERSGGRLTDEVELRMTQRLIKGDWNMRD